MGRLTSKNQAKSKRNAGGCAGAKENAPFDVIKLYLDD